MGLTAIIRPGNRRKVISRLTIGAYLFCLIIYPQAVLGYEMIDKESLPRFVDPNRVTPMTAMMFAAHASETTEQAQPEADTSEPVPAETEEEKSTGSRSAPGQVTFDINGFEVEGNTLLLDIQIRQCLLPFIGKKMTSEDVETARFMLEKYYHQAGYPTVLINIPEQTVEKGLIRLEVVESTIKRVRITGNRYFTMEKILKELPSLKQGAILYLPNVQSQLNKINRNPDIKVAPLLSPGKRLGTIDVELKVKDNLPLHGSLELSNRATHDTTDLRLNGSIRYDNLWMKDHSISLQYQVAPEDTDEVKVTALSYVLPSFINDDHVLAFYGIASDSDTAFGDGFEIQGKGTIVGMRYVMPLPPYENYIHSLNLGIDYKDFEDTLVGIDETPITYMPLSMTYSSGIKDTSGTTQFSAVLNASFRGLVANKSDFDNSRIGARGNYVNLIAGVERNQTLPAGLEFFVKMDGQISDQPLISNEQYLAGGMMSVRGYKENESAGDQGVHLTTEFRVPDLGGFMPFKDKWRITPYVFYDMATLSLKSPLPGENASMTLKGAGGGVRGSIMEHLEFEVDWAVALEDSERIQNGDNRFYFLVKAIF